MSYFNPHNNPTMREISREIICSNLKKAPECARLRIEAMPSSTPKELRAKRDASERYATRRV